jgi:hypothetical protein
LNRCRKLFSLVENQVLAMELSPPHLTESLHFVAKQNRLRKFPSERTFLESLSIFIKHRDIRWLLGVVVVVCVWKLVF